MNRKIIVLIVMVISFLLLTGFNLPKIPIGDKSSSGSKSSGNNNGIKIFGAVKDIATSGEIGPVDEYFIGMELSARVLGKYKLLNNRDLVSYIQKVAYSLIHYSNMPHVYSSYKFIIIDTDEINAFAAPGGWIFITKGMLRFLENEDELACILSHEIAHVELRHGASTMGQEKILKLMNLMKALAADGNGGNGVKKQVVQKLFDEISNKIFDMIREGYSVDVEYEADNRGIEIAANAGYNPESIISVFTRFEKFKSTNHASGYPKDRKGNAKLKISKLDEYKKSQMDRKERFTEMIDTM